jgi:hypothetical protein
MHSRSRAPARWPLAAWLTQAHGYIQAVRRPVSAFPLVLPIPSTGVQADHPLPGMLRHVVKLISDRTAEILVPNSRYLPRQPPQTTTAAAGGAGRASRLAQSGLYCHHIRTHLRSFRWHAASRDFKRAARTHASTSPADCARRWAWPSLCALRGRSGNVDGSRRLMAAPRSRPCRGWM